MDYDTLRGAMRPRYDGVLLPVEGENLRKRKVDLRRPSPYTCTPLEALALVSFIAGLGLLCVAIGAAGGLTWLGLAYKPL